MTFFCGFFRLGSGIGSRVLCLLFAQFHGMDTRLLGMFLLESGEFDKVGQILRGSSIEAFCSEAFIYFDACHGIQGGIVALMRGQFMSLPVREPLSFGNAFSEKHCIDAGEGIVNYSEFFNEILKVYESVRRDRIYFV